MLALAHRIDQLRLARGYTKDDMATALGISPNQAWKYLRGQDQFRFTRLVQVADWLGVPLPELLTGLPQAGAPPATTSTQNRKLLGVSQAYQRLSQRQQRYVLELLQDLAGR